MPSLRILVFTQGYYGQRILNNIRGHSPSEWRIEEISLPNALPQVVEEPEEIVGTLNLSGEWDLIIFLGESPSAFSLLSTILRQASAKAVIAPADDYSWLPLGLEQQIRTELYDLGIDVAFPRPFCTLAPTGVPSVDEFARWFGTPKLKIKSNRGVVERVEVIRGAPCGSTWHMAEKLVGTEVERAAGRSALLVQTYPCLASRRVERFFADAPIHVAGRIAYRAVEEALKTNEQMAI